MRSLEEETALSIGELRRMSRVILRVIDGHENRHGCRSRECAVTARLFAHVGWMKAEEERRIAAAFQGGPKQ